MFFLEEGRLGKWSRGVAWAVLVILCIIIGAGILALSRINFDGQWVDSLTQLTQGKGARDTSRASTPIVRRTLKGSIFEIKNYDGALTMDDAVGYMRLLVKEDQKVYSIAVASSTEIIAGGQPAVFAGLKPMIEVSVVAVELPDTASHDFSAEKIDVLTKPDDQKTAEEKLEEFRKFRPIAN